MRGSSFYHALNRGNVRQAIFHKGEDYEVFLRVLVEGLERYPVELFSFTLMPHHCSRAFRLPMTTTSRSSAGMWSGIHGEKIWSSARKIGVTVRWFVHFSGDAAVEASISVRVVPRSVAPTPTD
jgi:hypothetical protein